MPLFQFTHPVWGATTGLALLPSKRPCFNSRTPCGARLCYLAGYAGEVGVSIHAPRLGRDTRPSGGGGRFFKFQFTHPMWGATISQRHIICHSLVSIHAPQWGATRVSTSETTEPNSFNSRTPCGVRLDWITSQTPRSCFNSRTPCGVRLYGQLHNGRKEQVSIHAPHVGCDSVRGAWIIEIPVSIHAPHVGCDIVPRRV